MSWMPCIWVRSDALLCLYGGAKKKEIDGYSSHWHSLFCVWNHILVSLKPVIFSSWAVDKGIDGAKSLQKVTAKNQCQWLSWKWVPISHAEKDWPCIWEAYAYFKHIRNPQIWMWALQSLNLGKCVLPDILLTLSFGCQMPIVEVIIHMNLHITLTGFVILLQMLSVHSMSIYIEASKTELRCNWKCIIHSFLLNHYYSEILLL